MRQVTAFAREILEMEDRIAELECEVVRLMKYEEDYHQLMGSTLRHNEKMMFGLLRMAMTPGVAEALSVNAEKTES